MTVVWNNVINGLLTVAMFILAAPPEIQNLVPPKYQHYVVTTMAVAMWIKSHYNLKAQPPVEKP